ncbi:phosphoglycerate mutase [Bifidobacterium dolichotidis]|uniref:Phosphoglycerate mutase n=1 Tax=Bifidobacterium dolichotidis TaxID=2306976 RepID=A0A430FTB2_9BIFI|nr:histidine phosphatase family protein [Bifidobacterium dolichotidis]RSX56109.1 phosphoglycerate mutase [Bifidobacterium dolichotidis]
MIQSVVLMRHGRTAFNLARRMQGCIDVPLDIVGHWQVDQSAYVLAQRYYWAKVSQISDVERGDAASTLSAFMSPTVPRDYESPNEGRDETLAELGRDVAQQYRQAPAAHRYMQVYSSDLLRAQQTAHAFADILGLDVQTDTRLRERDFGQWEGMTRAEIAEKFPEAYESWRRHEGGEEAYGVESRHAVGERGARAICSLVAHANATHADLDGTLFIVSHGSWINATVQTLIGIDVDDLSILSGMRNAFWTTLTPPEGTDPQPGKWILESYDEGPALAQVMDWDNGPEMLRTSDMPQWTEINGPKA